MINLSKGGNINLAKEAAGVTVFRIGLAWDANASGGADFDLDAAAIPCGADGKAVDPEAICFYHQLDWKGALKHSGDERTGAAAGDDETITVDLAKMPAEVQKVVVLVNIHDAQARNQNFGMVKNAKVHLYEGGTSSDGGDKIVANYDLEEDASMSRCLVFCELYRKDNDWKFKAINESKGAANEVIYRDILRGFGLDVANSPAI